MGNFHSSILLRKSILCLVISSFSLSAIAPLSSYEYRAGINLNDIAFLARMERLYEKAKKYKDSLDSKKLIECMLDIKIEVEAYTGKKISISSKIDEIEKQSSKNGAVYKKGEIKELKKIIHKYEKKKEHKFFFMNDCYMNDVPFDASVYEIIQELEFDCKKDHDKEDKEEKEVYIPVTVSIGVTAALCGYFLRFIPHPACQAASLFLVTQGLELCVTGTIARLEENKKVDAENERKK